VSSDDLKDDFPGATKGLFASIGLMLLFVGGDMIADKEGLRVGLGLFIVLIGAACFYASFAWGTAKKILSDDAQRAISHFSQNRITWGGIIFLLFQTFILSRFVEEHRWPFSYPADPAVITENNNLKNQMNNNNAAISREKEFADKWRFAKRLRDTRGLDAKELCHYQLAVTPKLQSSTMFWHELLRYGGWVADRQGPTNSALIQPGITLRIFGDELDCATTLQRVLTDIYPNPPSKIAPNQQTSCGKDCVLIEMDY
jgi:hypothetical protein